MSKSIVKAGSLAVPSGRTLLVLSVAQILLGVCSGCRSTTDNQIDLLERELRVQEDYIYELEDYVVEYSEKLRSCRSCPPSQTAAYSEEVYRDEPELAPQRAKQKPRGRAESNKQEPIVETEEPSIDLDAEPPEEDNLPSPPEPKSSPEFSPEDIEVPDEIDLDIEGPISQSDAPEPVRQAVADLISYGPREDGSLYIPDPVGFESTLTRVDDDQLAEDLFADDQIEATAAIVEPRVAEKLEVARLFRDEGDAVAPESLLTVIEGLDANGEPIELEGEVSLMVMTTNGTTPERLKRWNFTEEETTNAWQSTDLGDGLHLELPLEELQLPISPLELWVRVVTNDGRKLLAQLPFETNQLGEVAPELPQPLPVGLAQTESVTSSDSTSGNSLRDAVTVTESQQTSTAPSPATKQPRWRSATQRTDPASESFSTTTAKNSGWTRQALGRQPYVSAQVASRPKSPRPLRQPRTPAQVNPAWTSSR